MDPLAALEKTAGAQTLLNEVQIPRIESLQSASEHYNADPYALSKKVRKHFREEKKEDLKKRKADDNLKGRYGLPSELKLLEDDEEAVREAKAQWEAARMETVKRRKSATPVSGPAGRPSSSTSSAAAALRSRLLHNTAKTKVGSLSSSSKLSKP